MIEEFQGWFINRCGRFWRKRRSAQAHHNACVRCKAGEHRIGFDPHLSIISLGFTPNVYRGFEAVK